MVPDHAFSRYVAAKEDLYDDGSKMNPNSLMLLCANKYKILVQKGLWNEPTAQDKEIIALKAQIKKISRPKSEVRSPSKKKKPKNPESKKKGEVGKKPEWISKPPINDEKGKSKKVDNKVYHRCPTHK